MNLHALGRLVSQQRRARSLTLLQLAAAARVGRSTLAAFEAGTLAELGFVKVARICQTLDLVLEVRRPTLEAPLMPHRHLTEAAGRELTKAAIEDVIIRGDISAWRGLVRSMRADQTGRIPARAREVAASLSHEDPKARAFAALLPDLLHAPKSLRR